MEMQKNYGDFRQTLFCVYCGGETSTKDHIPSKVLLDNPLPENLHIVPACLSCNSGFSLDEEYFACLIECALHGETLPSRLKREKIKKILSKRPALLARLERTKFSKGETTYFHVEKERLESIVLKLAKGHVAFQNNEPMMSKPIAINFYPLDSLSEKTLIEFENTPPITLLPEVGSRSMQNIILSNGEAYQPWITVQENRYRFIVFLDGPSTIVRIVISEYLACEVIWE